MFHNENLKLTSVYCQNRPGKTCNHQGGSALVIAIFVIVVMSLLGAALVKMLDSSGEAIAYEVMGTRAFTAAQTGLQWQLAQVFPFNTPQGKACDQIFTNNNTPSLAAVSGLERCSMTIICSDTVFDNVRYYTVTSTGTCDFNSDSTARTLEVQARSL